MTVLKSNAPLFSDIVTETVLETPLQKLLNHFRNHAQTEREKGTYFEELILKYLQTEPQYKNLYQSVQTYAHWAKAQGKSQQDDGIDLVAITTGGETHAIQCKLYDQGYTLQKRDIDSFFTASGKAPFTNRIIVSTTNKWSPHAENALIDQTPPVTKIDLFALEESVIDWAQYQPDTTVKTKAKYPLKCHQKRALNAIDKGFETANRGKMIMACGTGKTFTSLKIAEQQAGVGKNVLFLVPSLSLLSQTLTEWTQQSDIPLNSFAVCSDNDVGKKKSGNDDAVQTLIHELSYPATTNAESLYKATQNRSQPNAMTVVFSTYHSLATIHEAQKLGLADFDLIICDEAHRTTGATFSGDDESSFVRIHDNDYVAGHKRLYMTATPRIYGNDAKIKAEVESIELCSMDDPAKFGKTLFTINFAEAVEKGLLVDYKVLVLAVDEMHINQRLQKLLSDENNSLKVDDAARIVGCWKALSMQGIEGATPMQRAVAFCDKIEIKTRGNVSSKQIAAMFQTVVEVYQEAENDSTQLTCEVQHVDGSMNASQKEEKLAWLRAETAENTCRIVSNVKCLSEGVDVPTLDAVLFLTPKTSQVDVVQSVGRIMRNAPNKELGYVILPVVIPHGMEAHDALDNNQNYKVVWDVLNALRSHDERLNAKINQAELEGKSIANIEVIPVTNTLNPKIKRPSDKDSTLNSARTGYGIGEKNPDAPTQQLEIEFEIGDIERALYAKIVKKCGQRLYWEDWAKDIANIAQTHINRITTIVQNPENTVEAAAFNGFAGELRDDLNPSISDDEVIEMLAQHLITKPVFDALFQHDNFAANNPVSQAMQDVLDVLQTHNLHKEADTLEQFYESVRRRVAGINTAEGKQKIIVQLYDKFFRNAFPRLTERLGIVYTPVEVVDFIIHSVNDVLQNEFGETLGSQGVHIIDPFTGTGTFITRMLQSGLITPEQLPHKYDHEIHANEIVLLAYYIAAINIESTYHALMGGDYKPFQGICLTDTFQLYEKDDMVSELLVDNSERRMRQKNLDIQVIMGNPPYSAGQQSANDNAANVDYPLLNKSIAESYARHTKATNKNALYDSYIRAIRWGSDQLKKGGVLAYVSGGAWVERAFATGIRKCLREEFTNLYVFHLRGDVRKNMLSKGAAKEGQNIFDSGSMTGIAISVFVKNPNAKSHGNIYFHDIGDDLTTQQKKDKITEFKSINGITDANAWQTITPDKHNDWLNQRDNSFEAFIKMGDKKDKQAVVLFENYSNGLKTQRDAWCYNFSNKGLSENIGSMIDFYNQQIDADKIDNDTTKISWTRALRNDFVKGKKIEHNGVKISACYRPFTKQWLYYDRRVNEMVYQMPQIFPSDSVENKVICVSGIGSRSGFSSLIVDKIPDLGIIESSQCFPLYLYTKQSNQTNSQADLLAETPAHTTNGYTRTDAITTTGLQHFQQGYNDDTITKEDIFYYTYGILHSPQYREKYADNLSKELPRIPLIKGIENFWQFVEAGRKLANLHLNYEVAKKFPATIVGNPETDADYYVTKMKFAGSGKNKDKTTIIYNANITITNIPERAFDYIVNGKPALEWVMERQGLKTDKASGIVNDANRYAIETVGNAKYSLELLLRIIIVSLETLDIVDSLPKGEYLNEAN